MNPRFPFGQLGRRQAAAAQQPLAIVATAVFSAVALVNAHAENSSLSKSNRKEAEAIVASEALLAQNDQLQKQLSLDRETVKTITDSLVVSNVEAELFRRKFADLQLRMDALGVESADKDRAKLEQRLLKAVSDLQILQKEKVAVQEQLLQLTEAVLRYVKTSTNADADARMEVETQIRATNQLVAKKPADLPNESDIPSLLDGKVLSVKEEWSLVVGNIGAQQGVKIGMPLRVMRSGRNIATLRVVDVRDLINGAVVQEMDSEKDKIKVGDRLQVDAQPAVSQN